MSGRWTDEEHQGFLRGLEMYGYGNWDAIAVFIPSRSTPQVEAYAQHVAHGVPQGHGGGAGSRGSDSDSNSNGSGARSPGGDSPSAAQQQYQHQAQYQQQHEAQQQPDEQHQQRQVWSRTGLLPVANNPGSEQEMRRQLDTNGVCYGTL